MKKNAIDLSNMDFCTGCKMCADICPVKAISFSENCEGFWYPVIEENKCMDCGLCKKRCPAIKKDKADNQFTPIVYSAASRDSDIRGLSTSGGLFYELASYIIFRGGVVVGSSYSNDYKYAYHSVAESEEELYSLMGTKYFQSDTANIFAIVKDYLDKGREVLFCGTPCQNAALKQFLGKENENLLQMDFVCNSISSPLAYRKWLEELECKYSSKVKSVRFKDKKEGWINLNTEVYFENGDLHRENRANSLWTKGFIKFNLYQRKCCYQCNFRGSPNTTADITVGDFWGLSDLDYYDMTKGVSLVILNTYKGHNLFEMIKKNLIYKKRTLQDVMNGNPRLMNDPVYHTERDDFFIKLKNKSFSECVVECTREKVYEVENRKISLKEIRDIVKDGNISLKDYIYLNYYSPNVIRKGEAKIIPYKNSIFDLGYDARIVLYGDQNVYVGSNKLKKSKAETLVRLGKNAIFEIYHGGKLYYGTTIEVRDHAKFSTGRFSLNTGSVVIVQKYIKFGESVMCGRNCVFLDSDFHQLQTMKGLVINPPKKIEIKDHVWITGDARILPGSLIGCNSIIGSNTVIKGEIPDWSYVDSSDKQRVSKFIGRWSGNSNNIAYGNVNSKGTYRQVLVGFGKEGRAYYERQVQFIEAVIDNNSKDERTVKFKEFCKEFPQIDEDMLFVIGSSKYYKELYNMVKKQYPKAKIANKNEIYLNLD